MRAFIGTFLSPDAQRACQQLSGDLAARHGDVLRAVPSGSTHLTYVFVAALDDARQATVVEALRRVAASHETVALTFSDPRVLSAGSTPRLVHTEIVEGADQLRRLADDLAAAVGQELPGTRITPMKTAHVTLARFRRQASRRDGRIVATTLAESRFALTATTEHVVGIQLVASTLTPSGSVYAVIESCGFG